MYFPNTESQSGLHRTFRADGTLASGSAPQLVLPQALARCNFVVQNISVSTMWLEMGCARATATISGGVVNSITVGNGGFGFTLPPSVEVKGGAGGYVTSTASGWNGIGLIGSPDPVGVNLTTTPPNYFRPCRAHAVLSTGVVSSIVIDDGGAGYVNPPEVLLFNNALDPFGCADPSVGSGSGIELSASGGAFSYSGTACPTDALALFGSISTKFTVVYMV